jgi:hypothetical protein
MPILNRFGVIIDSIVTQNRRLEYIEPLWGSGNRNAGLAQLVLILLKAKFQENCRLLCA